MPGACVQCCHGMWDACSRSHGEGASTHYGTRTYSRWTPSAATESVIFSLTTCSISGASASVICTAFLNDQRSIGPPVRPKLESCTPPHVETLNIHVSRVLSDCMLCSHRDDDDVVCPKPKVPTLSGLRCVMRTHFRQDTSAI